MPAAPEFAIPSVLRERADRRPNDPAFTFVDYARDPAGVADTLTWSQLYRRTRAVANALTRCGSAGDRAVIVAPQSLDYVVGFLGALEAGFIAVPLSVPQLGDHDERISSVLADSSPAAVLTTAAVSGGLEPYLQEPNRSSAPTLVEVDALDRIGPAALAVRDAPPGVAYLQYTSGSTRQPAGVMVSHRNLAANFEQTMACYFSETGNVPPPDTTMVSWLPFYHDMGLWIGVSSPILAGLHSVVFSPMSFLVRPSRWIHLMATHPKVFTPAPNFALELAVRRTTDADMAGLDLGDVTHIISGAERVHAATLQRFTDRFAPFGLRTRAMRPSYGLAEATVYVADHIPGRSSAVVHFDAEKLTAGIAERTADATGPGLVSYGIPASPTVRIVDPETRTENGAGTIGEIWVHGDNVALGYWHKSAETEQTFRGRLVDPHPGTPAEPWLRTGDLGVVSDGELFIMGRIKDLLIVYGRNHYPDDIEATVGEITGGRVAAISVHGDHDERLVVLAEFMTLSLDEDAVATELAAAERAIASAVSTAHGVKVADLVLVFPGSLPLTTSGKVRRGACAHQYLSGELDRIDEDDDADAAPDEESTGDVLVVDGHEHHSEGIEATASAVTGGRVAAIADDRTGRLIAIAELTAEPARPREEQSRRYRTIKREVMSAVKATHGVRVADLVLVPAGAIPVSATGTVRRPACAQRYRDNEFKRLDVSASLLDEAW